MVKATDQLMVTMNKQVFYGEQKGKKLPSVRKIQHK